MSEIEKIQRYIDRTGIVTKIGSAYGMRPRELSAIYEIARRNEFRAMALIFTFGQAKGYRAAKAEARR